MSWFNGLEHIVREQEPMAPWNWLRLGGVAEYFAEPTSIEELTEILSRTSAEGIPLRLLGAGSNVLVRDEGVQGVVVHLSAPIFGEITVAGTEIRAGGGAKLSQVVSTSAREGLSGIEALVGIPGTIGGALRRNASGHGAAIGQWTNSIDALTRAGERVNLQKGDLRFGYHESNLDALVILNATFLLEPSEAQKVTRQMQKLWIMKRAKQPSGELGYGQVFGDSRGMTAGEIIEQAGAKGLRSGGVSVSETDPNFVEVKPGASSDDVFSLIEDIRGQVSDVLGVDLVPQIEVW